MPSLPPTAATIHRGARAQFRGAGAPFASLAMRRSPEYEQRNHQYTPEIRAVEREGPPENRRHTKHIIELGWAGKWFEIKEYFNSIPDKTTIIYNAAMASADRCRRYDEGLHVWDEMRAAGLGLTAVSYASAMTLLGRQGRYAEVRELWAEMHASKVRATSACLTALLNAAAVSGDTDAVRATLREAEKSGWRLEIPHWGSLVRAAREAADAPGALDAVRELRAGGLTPNVVCYTMAMGACSRAAGRGAMAYDQVVEFIKELKAEMLRDAVIANGFFIEEEVKALLGGGQLEIWLRGEPPNIEPSAIEAALLALDASVAVEPDSYDDKESERAVVGKAPTAGPRRTRLMSMVGDRLRELLEYRNAAPAPVSAPSPLPPGWHQATDPGSGAAYYWQEVDPTGTTTWVRPS